jgi:hypothetical protein
MASDNPCGLQKRTPNLLEAFAVFMHVVASQRRFFELAAQSHQARRYLSGSAEPKNCSPNTLCNSPKSLLKTSARRLPLPACNKSKIA